MLENERDNNVLKYQKSVLAKDIVDLKSMKATLVQQNVELKAEISTMLEKYNNMVSKYNNTLTINQQDLNTIVDEIKNNKTLLNDIELEIVDKQLDLDNIKLEYERINAIYTKLLQDKESTEATVNDLNKRTYSLDQERTQLLEENMRLGAENTKLKDNIAKANIQYNMKNNNLDILKNANIVNGIACIVLSVSTIGFNMIELSHSADKTVRGVIYAIVGIVCLMLVIRLKKYKLISGDDTNNSVNNNK